MLLILFACSGALGLIFQTASLRKLTLEMGSNSLAVATVVAVFMAGLALGADILGRRASALKNPLATYGRLEIAIGLLSLLCPAYFAWFLPIFVALGSSAPENIFFLSAGRFLLAFLVLLPPTACMGATLPALAEFATRRPRTTSSVEMLYSANTLGACCGCLVAGLWLLPKLGLNNAIYLAATANIAVGVMAIALSKALPQTLPHPEPAPTQAINCDSSGTSFRWFYLASALAGCAALICEVAWTRILVLVVGASVYAFSITLAVFLAGLGLGAIIIARLSKTRALKPKLYFYCSCLTGFLVVISSSFFSHLPSLYISLFEREAYQNLGMFWYQFLFAAIVMLFPTLLMGTLLPLMFCYLRDSGAVSARTVGRLYAVNTSGAILGSVGTGFFLIPLLGLRNAVLFASLLFICSAISFLAFYQQGKVIVSSSLASITVLLLLWALTPGWNQQVMTSGVSVYAASYQGQSYSTLADHLANREKLLYYRDGLSSTVTVSQDRNSPNHDLYISTNGKIDGSSVSDMPTQRLSAHLPILLHPAPKHLAVIGMGTGCSAGSASLHPGVVVDLVEIEPAMVEGARLFAEHNHGVHQRENVEIHLTDGRLFLALHPQAFDVIISEPSNPWLAGAGDLFTVEAFAHGAAALKPGGIFAQWLQLYDLTPQNVAVVIRSFQQIFPYTYLAVTIPDTDVILLGSQQEIKIYPAIISPRLLQAEVYRDLADRRVGVSTVADLLAHLWLGPTDINGYLAALPGPLNTDTLPIIPYQAPLSLFSETRQQNSQVLAQYARGVVPLLNVRSDVFIGDALIGDAFLSDLHKRYEARVPQGLPRFFLKSG